MNRDTGLFFDVKKKTKIVIKSCSPLLKMIVSPRYTASRGTCKRENNGEKKKPFPK